MKRITFLIGLPFYVTVSAAGAYADGAYHWVDSTGRDHYGSNPPKDARSVEAIAGKNVSHYSSEKLLRPFHGGPVSEDAVKAGVNSKYKDKSRTITPPLPTEPQPPGPPTAKGKGKPAIKETPLIDEGSFAAPELKQGELTLKHDKENRVTELAVVVQNSASIPANNVLVSFEFPDGTLVPGAGPDSIDAASSSKYSVPSGMLPITINGPQGSLPRPKVIIKGAGD